MHVSCKVSHLVAVETLHLEFVIPYLEDLALEGCCGINDESLITLRQGWKSLKTLNISHSENVTYVGVSSLTSEGLSSTQSVGPLGYECINENESAASSMLLPETKSLNYHSISSVIPLSIPFDTTFFSDAAQENASMRSPLEKRKPPPALVRLCLGIIGKHLEDVFDGLEVLTSFSPDIKMAILPLQEEESC
ncbi:RNI-like superfamily protein [Tanacetum coccineum]